MPPAARTDDQAPRRLLVLSSLTGRRTGLYAAVAAVTYLLALLAFLPARAALQLSGAPVLWSDAAGSAWDGELALRDRVRLGWEADGLRSLFGLGLAAEATVSGPGTDLTGQLRLRPGSVAVSDLTGEAGWALVSAMAPAAPIRCDLTLRLRPTRVALGSDAPGVEGLAESEAGVCTPTGGVSQTPAPVPPLVATATANDAGSTVVLARRDDRAATLATLTLARGGRLSLQVTDAGAATVPGAFVGGFSAEGEL